MTVEAKLQGGAVGLALASGAVFLLYGAYRLNGASGLGVGSIRRYRGVGFFRTVIQPPHRVTGFAYRARLSSFGSSQDRVTDLACSCRGECVPREIFCNRDVESLQRHLVQSQHNFGHQKSCWD